jgi:hypothetical protein
MNFKGMFRLTCLIWRKIISHFAPEIIGKFFDFIPPRFGRVWPDDAKWRSSGRLSLVEVFHFAHKGKSQLVIVCVIHVSDGKGFADKLKFG